MRIAQIEPLYEAIPPKSYGGTERVVSYHTEALVEAGHEVTLFASGNSQTTAKLDSVWPQALRLDSTIRDRMAPIILQLTEVFRRAHEFDILHFHLDYLPFPLFTNQSTPFLTTLHGRLDLPELEPIFSTYDKALVVSISNNQRTYMPQANWLSTIHHGLPETLLTPNFQVQPHYLAFLGRICPEKAVDRAIRIAGATGMKLRIAAKIDEVDRLYFETEIKDLFTLPHVEYIGEISEAEKSKFLGNAFGLLFPINWPEAFGLVMIEAMACGTPVIAFNRGSVPEVIEDGVTGFIVEDELSAITAVKRLHSLSRAEIRK
jgi:glycosyltransferase involved in cell wall biosynthesis